MKFLVLLFCTVFSFTVFAQAPKKAKKKKKSVPVVVTKKKITEKLVEITTEYGVMIARLYDSTPLHRDNFLKLVQEKFYDSLLFHRVIKNFMIQGGDPDSKTAPAGKPLGNGGPSYRIPAEFRSTLFHKKGVIAAARDNNPSS